MSTASHASFDHLWDLSGHSLAPTDVYVVVREGHMATEVAVVCQIVMLIRPQPLPSYFQH